MSSRLPRHRDGRRISTLPRLLVLTDRHACESRGRSLAETVAAAVAAGARAVMLREKDLPLARRRAIGFELAALLVPAGGTLVVASDPGLARELGTVHVHLAASDPLPAAGDRSELLLGRSCHDLGSLLAAAAEGAAYATLSPVFASRSKPGYGPALREAGLAAGVRSVPRLSVFALGGVDAGTASACRGAGAAGVAVMGAVMAAADPGAATLSLLRALEDRGRGGRSPSGSPREPQASSPGAGM